LLFAVFMLFAIILYLETDAKVVFFFKPA
jgi:hypothetical protein